MPEVYGWVPESTKRQARAAAERWHAEHPEAYVQPVSRDELAALNPGMDERGLARLQAFSQIMDEDDAATGYREPGEPPDSCEGEPDPMSRTCDDCGAQPGEACAWSCSSNWR